MREISLLGTVRVESSDAEVPRFRSQRATALLGYLAIERRALMRTHLAALLWPDETPESGKTKLRRELYNLAQILPGCWEVDRLKVHFVPASETTVDLDLIRQHEQEENWEAAANLLCGDFLEGLVLGDNLEFETWLLGERERWRQRAASILARATDELEHLGSYRRALNLARRLLQIMPWREETHRRVMRLLALSDQRSAALKQFEICKQMLWDELGVEPSLETRTLYKHIRRSSHFSHDNIPAILTPLIGRKREMETLSSLLVNPNVRLVTITGLGGIGKTRLALDAAWRHTKGQFQDGVTFVQLAALESAERLIPTISQGLHLPLIAEDENEALGQLLAFLSTKQALLVFDNCERVLEEMAIAADILQAAPGVQILATSREPLRLIGEHVFTLQGLDYNQEKRDNPAALMFCTAAQRVVPDFTIDSSNTADVNQLCRILDGMPLALELAATWLDTLPVTAIVTEIENSLDFLTTDLQNMPSRHRSLLAVLNSTWGRLKPQTCQIFAALSVFRGSFSRDAAQELVGAAPHLLGRLVAHSLLQFDRETDRYQLHEMLRQFAAEKLASMPEFEQDVNRRHFIFCNDLALHGGEAMRGSDQMRWISQLTAEQGNIYQAIDWAANNDIESAAKMIVSLHVFWYTLGLNQEAIQRCERLLPYRDCLSPHIIPWLLAVYAEALVMLGYAKESVLLAYEALPLFRDQNDDAGSTFIFTILSMAARGLNADIDISVRLGDAGLPYTITPRSDSYYTSLLLESLSDSLTRSGRFDEADARIKQGYHLCIQRDDRMGVNYFLAQMSLHAIMQDQRVEARRLAEECLSRSRQLGMLVAEFIALDFLGIIERMDGNFDLAEQYITDGLLLARQANYEFYLAGFVLDMGDILMAKGRFQEALPFLREAAVRFQAIEDQVFTAAVITSLAKWAWHGNKQNASPARWVACATAQQERQLLTPYAYSWLAGLIVDLQAGLSEEAFTRAWEEGQNSSVEEVMNEISLALLGSPS